MEEKILYDMRKDYAPTPLKEEMLCINPFIQFDKWFEDARKIERQEANAMILSTCGDGGTPSSRVVLLKRVSKEGFVFFTNYQSKKGEQINRNPNGSILFFWPETMRQIRIEGVLSKISESESEEYFSSRPNESRAAAILSKQSRPLPNKEEFDADVLRFAEIDELKKPDFWGGYILKPSYFEFWQGAISRTHDRFSYNKNNGEWGIVRLYP